MSSFVGMEIAAVRQLAMQLGAKADEIDQLAAQLTQQLAGTQWVGSDATRFRDDWQSVHVPALRNVSGAVRTARDAATRNADEQDQASS